MIDFVRYSPQPLSFYSAKVHGVRIGPMQSPFFADDPEAWNLAFLSHDYESSLLHPDPNFTVHVRRTIQTVIATGLPDLTNLVPAELSIRGQLRLPASVAAAFLLYKLPCNIVEMLPLFKAYGRPWLEMLERRAWELSGMPEDRPLESFDDALRVIQRARRGFDLG
jgi:hypothetical protein